MTPSARGHCIPRSNRPTRTTGSRAAGVHEGLGREGVIRGSMRPTGWTHGATRLSQPAGSRARLTAESRPAARSLFLFLRQAMWSDHGSLGRPRARSGASVSRRAPVVGPTRSVSSRPRAVCPMRSVSSRPRAVCPMRSVSSRPRSVSPARSVSSRPRAVCPARASRHVPSRLMIDRISPRFDRGSTSVSVARRSTSLRGICRRKG
jgi:hypothetical protein